MSESDKIILVMGRLPGILSYLYKNREEELGGALYYLNHRRPELFALAKIPWEIIRDMRNIPTAEQQRVFDRLKRLLSEAEQEDRVMWKFSADTYPYAPLFVLLEGNGCGVDIDQRATTLMRNPAQIRKTNLVAVLEHLGINEDVTLVW